MKIPRKYLVWVASVLVWLGFSYLVVRLVVPSATSSMNAAHTGHTATLLPNGEVLIAGGSQPELYDPARGTWMVCRAMNDARSSHTATLLPDGKVLVAGGLVVAGQTVSDLASAELFDPVTGGWSMTGAMNTGREGHTATLLPNGKVLVVGGSNDGNHLATAELYDVATGTWTVTGSPHDARANFTANLLLDGMVLVVGGVDIPHGAELYDPATGSWMKTGSTKEAREGKPTATLLLNGKVLVVGGIGSPDTAELYDPVAGIWTVTGKMNDERRGHTATLLPNGKVLVVGGADSQSYPIASVELYDPATGTWSMTGSMDTARAGHTATLLPNGKVLVAGGTGSDWSKKLYYSAEHYLNGMIGRPPGPPPWYNARKSLGSSELYDPATGTWSHSGD